MTMRIPVLMAALLLAGPAVQAQTKATPKAKSAEKAQAKESMEATFARQSLDQVLDAVNAAWFGEAYEKIPAVELEGNLSIQFTAAAANAKVEQAGQGALKGNFTQGGTINAHLKGTYFANADFRTEFKGDFGTLLYTRTGNKGFLYSKELNAYTTKIDLPPTRPPQYFRTWFTECVNDIKAVYTKGTMFKATLGREDASGGQTLVFNAPTGAYDAKKREQSMAESLGFWKRGRLEVVFDKATKLPQKMNFHNEAQGIRTRMTFHYSGGRPTSVTLENQSRGMEGPASLTLSYNNQGRIDRLAGQMGFPVGVLKFDLGMSWLPNARPVASIPPVGSTKKGGDELETLLLVNLAGKVLDLQKVGFNLRSVTLTSK
ncbi:hypothetical protein [Mesoterricola sediminis]|uniref:Uncharacterized protein n=1 Tax=Mesoterricola sediminis TaxID=2927980 RepID=A0AA48KBZ8_9BACT|nr:hypothetical protein [Mesoterricola sediminis]BDU75590.1 hypothetical protein METESE_05480 [Mesoterricola sediminis]